MLIRPTLRDFKIIAFYTGKIISGLGLTLLIPAITAAAFSEWNMFFAFLLAFSISEFFWLATDRYFYTDRDLKWMQGMMVVSVSWLLATIIGAIPMYLSGYFSSFLDACFDVMSGFTTTGLTLIQDLDHAPYSLNMWRHLLQFIGAQGIIVLALTFFIRATRGALKIYIGEAREESLLPNVINTAKAIWTITIAYFVVGSTVLSVVNLLSGMEPVRAVLHGMWIYMTAWGTGGFAPQSLSVLYYHSPIFEFFTAIFMILGGMNFALHWSLWRGEKLEIFKNIEIRSFTITVALTFLAGALALVRAGVFDTFIGGFRIIYFQIISAHSGTGFMTVTAPQFPAQWGEAGMMAVVVAMALGASAGSTAGGIKAMRIGLVIKGIAAEVKRIISPEKSVVITYYHHIRKQILSDNQVKMAALIMLAYISMYLFGGILGQFYGIPFVQSLFDSVSAGANVGLTCGVTSPTMPALLKIYYILAMWMGRLEFTSIFALSGFIVALVKGR